MKSVEKDMLENEKAYLVAIHLSWNLVLLFQSIFEIIKL